MATMYDDMLNRLDESYCLKKLEEMIRIPSVVGEEKELAHYLFDELEALGYDAELHTAEPGRPNVYAKLEGEKPGKRINFNGHLDTVPVVPGWDTDPFTPVQREGRIHGLGACDMKGGIACILDMLRGFTESSAGFSGELSFSGVIDEEAYGMGAKAMLKTGYRDVDAIVLAEPYLADEARPTALGITGKILYDIHVHGRAAHAFSPELGVNAVEQAGVILANLQRLHIPEHPQFKGNYCTLKIEGGYEVYSVVVPAFARLEVNRLTVPGETKESVVKDMEALIDSLGLDAEVEVRVKPPYYASYVMSSEEPLVKVFEESYREAMGADPYFGYSSSITDANTFMGEGGIPCIHLGPFPGGAHQKNEYTTLDSLPPVSKTYMLMAAKILEACHGK